MYHLLLVCFLSIFFQYSFPVAISLYAEERLSQKTVYIYRPLINGEDLRQWAVEQGISSTLKPEKMHLTLAFSKRGLDKENVNKESHYILNTDEQNIRTLELFGTKSSILVLKVEEPQFVERWATFLELGSSWDWATYQPHITITYQTEGVDLSKIAPYHGVLIFGPEVIEEIDESILEKIEEI